jgi:hypothetical protein
MGFREQQKLMTELKPFAEKMAFADKEAYKLFVKRQKDEEEFDTLSMDRLRGLHTQYYKPKPKPDFDKYFRKPE